MTATDEHDANDRRPRSALAVWLVAAALSLPILYVLSIGPANRLWKERYISGRVLDIYLPLELACDACPLLGRAVISYQRLWDSPRDPMPPDY